MASQDFDSELTKLGAYADEKLNPVFKAMLAAVLSKCPEDPVEVSEMGLLAYVYPIRRPRADLCLRLPSCRFPLLTRVPRPLSPPSS